MVRVHYDLAASQYNHSINILSMGFLDAYMLVDLKPASMQPCRSSDSVVGPPLSWAEVQVRLLFKHGFQAHIRTEVIGMRSIGFAGQTAILNFLSVL
jgi:hypothetical protein